MKRKSNRYVFEFMTKIAIFTSLSIILYFFPKFPLPFFPSFLKIQFSNLPALLGGFAIGPLGGSLIVVIRTLVNIPLSSTAGAGEIADLIIGLSVVLTSSLIYKKHRNKKGGIVALALSSLVWIIMGVLTNAFINVNLYVNLYFGGHIEPLVSMCKIVIPTITKENFMLYYLLFAVVPFNLLLSISVCTLTYLIYKRLSIIMRKLFLYDGKTKVLVISDSFKGTLSSKEVGKIVTSELLKKDYHAKYLCISDGGEGFLECIKQSDKDLKYYEVTSVNAFLETTKSKYLYNKKTKQAYFCLAECCGITKINNHKLDPFIATTYGLGDTIKQAIKSHDIKSIVIGLGGSCSDDAGLGVIAGLGGKFYNCEHELKSFGNQDLSLITSYDLTNVYELIKGIKIDVWCDVTSELLGNNGATILYGIQKGATTLDLDILENNIKHYHDLVLKTSNKTIASYKFMGAAGGVSFSLNVLLNASLTLGIDKILDVIEYKKHIKDVDLIITGEGIINEQTFKGKVIKGIIDNSNQKINCICGKSTIKEEYIFSIEDNVCSVEESIADPKSSLKELIKKIY